MEGGGQEFSLLGGDNASIGQGRKDAGVGADRFNDRGADENRVIRVVGLCGLFERRDIQVDLERVHLAAEGVAFDGDVHQSQQGLGAAGVFREENGSGAGAPNGAFAAKGAQRFHQAKVFGQFADGGRFASGDNQPVQVFELACQPHFDGFDAQFFEHNDMFGKITLQGKDTNFHEEIIPVTVTNAQRDVATLLGRKTQIAPTGIIYLESLRIYINFVNFSPRGIKGITMAFIWLPIPSARDKEIRR